MGDREHDLAKEKIFESINRVLCTDLSLITAGSVTWHRPDGVSESLLEEVLRDYHNKGWIIWGRGNRFYFRAGHKG